jgi:hypothetical protein
LPYEFYNILHLTGVFGMLLALGAAAAAGPQIDQAARRRNGILHGIGMVLIVVAGFGMLARGNLGFPGWIVVKALLYIVIGALPMLARRREAPMQYMLIGLAVAFAAAWLAHARPF